MTSHQPGVQQDAIRSRRNAALVLVPILALLAVLVWQRFHPVSEVAPATPLPVATAASAASVASAPQAAASAAALVKAAPAAVESKTYTVKDGDTLSKRFGQHWKAVCDLNTELLKDNCHHLEIGWVLKLPEGVEPLEDQVPSAKKVAKKAPKPVASQPTTTGEFQWTKVGGAPLRGCGSKDAATINEEAWTDYIRQGLMTEAERDELRELTRGMTEPNISLTSSEGRVELKPGDRFLAVSFCGKNGQATSRTNVLAAWDAEKTDPVFAQLFKLKSSVPDADDMVTEWLWVRNCHNWVPRKVKLVRPAPLPPPIVVPPSPPEPPASAPEPTLTPPPALPPVEPPPTVEAAQTSCGQLDLVFGQEFEPRYRNAANRSTYVSTNALCMWDGEDEYRYGFGFGGMWVDWDGYISTLGRGYYDGSLYLVGPAFKVVSGKGAWDALIRIPAYGQMEGTYHHGEYDSARRFGIRGFTLSTNFFGRKLEGEEWFYETSVSMAWAKPTSSLVGHNWQGQSITDTTDLGRFDYYANVSVREYIKRLGETSELYGQVGLNIEKPVSRSLSFRLGVAAYDRCVGVGAGFDHDLISNGNVPAIGYWVDPPQCFVYHRTYVRGEQIVLESKARGNSFDRNSIGPAP